VWSAGHAGASPTGTDLAHATARAAASEQLYTAGRAPRDLLDAARHGHLAGAAITAAQTGALLDDPRTPAAVVAAVRALNRQTLAEMTAFRPQPRAPEHLTCAGSPPNLSS